MPGSYLHIAYRREADHEVLFHMRAMSTREKRRYREPMKEAKVKTKAARIRLPHQRASYAELSDLFDLHGGFDLLDRGITEIDPDHEDLNRMLLEYWSQPNTKQLNIRIPPAAKRMIEKLAKRKTVEVSRLVRMWVIDSMRREAAQP
jgi:hypothetical protein